MQDPGADGAGGWGLFDPHRSAACAPWSSSVLGKLWAPGMKIRDNGPKILCLVKEDPGFSF